MMSPLGQPAVIDLPALATILLTRASLALPFTPKRSATMRNTLTAALRAIRSKIRGERLDAQAQHIADRMVEELRAAVADLKETRQDIRRFGKAMDIPDGAEGQPEDCRLSADD